MGCAALTAACLAGCGGGSTSPAAGGGSSAAHGGSSSGLQTAKLGQVLTGARVTGSTTLTPVPGALTGWDNSLSVKTGTTNGEGSYASAKGQRFLVADLSFGAGVMAMLGRGAIAGQASPFNLGSAAGASTPLATTTVNVTADGRTTPVPMPDVNELLPGSPADVPLAISTRPGETVTLNWKDGTISGAIDLNAGKVTSPTPAALNRTDSSAATGSGNSPIAFGNADILYIPGGFLSYFDQSGAVISPSPGDTELVVYFAPYPLGNGEVPITATLSANGATVPGTSGMTAWSDNLLSILFPNGATNAGIQSPLGGNPYLGPQVVMFSVPADFTSGTLTMTYKGQAATSPITVPAG